MNEKDKKILNNAEDPTENIEKLDEPESSVEDKVENVETNGSADKNNGEMKLDDARRVKAISPGLLVVKRFFRNKLAIVGLSILIVLFLFCFLGAAIYPYTQSETFTTYKVLQIDYAFAKINTDFTQLNTGKEQLNNTLVLMMNSHIKDMQAKNATTKEIVDSGKTYRLTKKKDEVYILERNDNVAVLTFASKLEVGTFTSNKIEASVTLKEQNKELSDLIAKAIKDSGNQPATVSVDYDGATYTLNAKNKTVVKNFPALTEITSARTEDASDALAAEALNNLGGSFAFGGVNYTVESYNSGDNLGYYVYTPKIYPVLYSTTLNFDRFNINETLSDSFKIATLAAIGDYDAADASTQAFTVNGKDYTLGTDDNGYLVSEKSGATTKEFVSLSIYSIRRYTGEDIISVPTKRAFRAVMVGMLDSGLNETNTTIKMEALDEEGNYKLDEGGNVVFEDEEFYVKTEEKGVGQQFVFRNMQSKLVADANAAPSSKHFLGLDANAMDVLARIMYGGRISLLIGFIVVFIEIILGTIMGGISGYFGGWVDNLIMRIVDVFYCIPTMPILIIVGAMFNTIKLDNTLRVVWMMAILGFLGWPGIARLVRGQILSLREQEFMIAAEASGLSVKRRIFRHLIPNVIPQLIVQATMGLGGIILTESTLSFLGLGVKYPMATWGQIINSVSSINEMKMYTYIWIPVGALICLAVIAFNFVGDGLRDAFDPKMNK